MRQLPELPAVIAASIEAFEQACEGVFSRPGPTRPVKARAALVQAICEELAKVNCAGEPDGSEQPDEGVCRVCLKRRPPTPPAGAA